MLFGTKRPYKGVFWHNKVSKGRCLAQRGALAEFGIRGGWGGGGSPPPPRAVPVFGTPWGPVPVILAAAAAFFT